MARTRMGCFRIDAELASLQAPGHFKAVASLLVDTGSELTWVRADLLRRSGVVESKRGLRFVTADGRTITRSSGYAILRAGGFETVDEVVFAHPDDLELLGARTLEGFGARVDAREKRLVASGPHPAALVSAGPGVAVSSPAE